MGDSPYFCTARWAPHPPLRASKAAAGASSTVPEVRMTFAGIGAGALATLAILANLIGILDPPDWLADGVSDAGAQLYPLPLMVLLSLALVAALVVPRVRRRQYPVEQGRLDRVLSVLPRAPIRELDLTEFLGGWSDAACYPVGIYSHEHDEIEDRFLDPHLEALRRALHTACVDFSDANALHGVPSRFNDRARNVGYTSGQMDGLDFVDPDAMKRCRESAHVLQETCDELVLAHHALTEAARQRGYSLAALDGPAPRPPVVRSWMTRPAEEVLH